MFSSKTLTNEQSALIDSLAKSNSRVENIKACKVIKIRRALKLAVVFVTIQNKNMQSYIKL